MVSEKFSNWSTMTEDIGSPLSGLVEATTEAAMDDTCFGGDKLGIDVIGLVAIIIFYVAVLAVGIYF